MSGVLSGIRPAVPGDAAAVGAILARSYGVLYRGWYTDDALAKALPAMTRANTSLLASGRYYVAEREGRLVACGGWSAAKPDGGAAPGLAHVRHFATDPDYINRGYGGAILRRALGAAKTAGFTEMEAISSLTAEAFYAGNGFRQIARLQLPFGGVSFACAVMRRRLDDAEGGRRQ